MCPYCEKNTYCWEQAIKQVERKAVRRVVKYCISFQLYSYQLFSAVNCLCNCKIIHLDIKPSNLVLNHTEGTLKLADFGNAVHFGTVGVSSYQVSHNVWSAACVTYDFITTRPLFKGRNTEDQVKLIVSVFGYPSSEEVKAMASYRPRVHRSSARGLDKFVGADFDATALSLLQDVLVYDPSKRKTAGQAMKHAYFEPLRQVSRCCAGQGEDKISALPPVNHSKIAL
ncbi:Protein kinase domain-containing protein, partial [Trichostrongylus colubriformis]